jgi:Ca2+-binding RTX toxin-like protein
MLGHWALGQEPLGGFGGPSGYVLQAETGHYTLAGQDATLAASITFTAEFGDYQLTGQDASLERGYKLVAAYGAYTLTGQEAGSRIGYAITAERGTYTLTGQNVAFVANRVLDADTIYYALTGIDVEFQRTFGATGIKHLHRMGNPIGAKSISLAPIKARTGYLRASAR